MHSPFIPPNEDNFSQKVVTEAFRDENEEKFKESLLLIDKPRIQSLFEGYYYDYTNVNNAMLKEDPQSQQQGKDKMSLSGNNIDIDKSLGIEIQEEY